MKSSMRSKVGRFAVFFGFWLVLDGGKSAGLPVGVATAVLAAWVSLRLLPPSADRPNVIAFFPLFGHFVWSSVVAGVDVAWRAFHPGLPVRPGFVNWTSRIPAGTRRDVFLDMASLMPGSLPVGENKDGTEVVHCLDTEQPTAREMSEHEGRLIRALGGKGGHA